MQKYIRRFIIHVLPDGFHRIRHYGLFANGSRAESIARARQLLNVPTPQNELSDANGTGAQTIDIGCGGWCRSVYGVGVTPSRSRARRWVAVGVARRAMRRSRPRRTILRVSVARSPSRVWKLCTGI